MALVKQQNHLQEGDHDQAVLSFPQKLYSILEDENSSILRWSENGYCFRILDYEKFIDTVLPKYFNRKFSDHFPLVYCHHLCNSYVCL